MFAPGVGLLPESNNIYVELLTLLFDEPVDAIFIALLIPFLNILL